MDEKRIKEIIREELDFFFRGDKFIFELPIQILDGRNIQTGKTTGTKIGTETAQLVGFYGVTPVDQGATIADPAGGGTVDAQARTAINALIDRLQDIGIIA